jgi:alpha-galactosidase
MGIMVDDGQMIFHLQAHDASYVIQVLPSGHLAHLYWGKRLHNVHILLPLPLPERPFSTQLDQPGSYLSLDTLAQEYPAYGHTDFRSPAYEVRLENGTSVSELKYLSHRLYQGKKSLIGLPATYVEQDEAADSLEIDLLDAVLSLQVTLVYTVFNELNVIARSVRFFNAGETPIQLERVMSLSMDFASSHYEFLHLPGAWGRERAISKTILRAGIQSVESRRGASSHQHNPFFALLEKDATETNGEVFGYSLIYSGNFLALAEVDQFQTVRVQLGINPFEFAWLLEAGDTFQTPEAVMVYADDGLGGMSRTFHELWRHHLVRGVYRDRVRPILMNNWEATYFDFHADQLLSLAKLGANMGIELFVLDDGWFGDRHDDKRSLGDWYVNRNKFPKGLADFVNEIEKMEMGFGLWMEPEMVSPDSELYRAHPDWCLHVPDHSRSLGRHQLVLDLTRREVVDYLHQRLHEILSSAPIRYVKWDMNRHMTEISSPLLSPARQRETAHRYILGLYALMESITSDFPHILFESCSGGGGRFDPGMLFYMPQTWTSDNTDAISRLFIQYGTSLVYPAITMGAHVSATPNHQTGRVTNIATRGHVAMSGNLGYELDLAQLTEKDVDVVREQVQYYKEIRPIVQFGHLFRLINPYQSNVAAWMYVHPDQLEAVVFYIQILSVPNPPTSRLRLKGLNASYTYQLVDTTNQYGGDELMNVGLLVPHLFGDFLSVIWRLTAR